VGHENPSSKFIIVTKMFVFPRQPGSRASHTVHFSSCSFFKVQKDKSKRALGEVERKFIKAEDKKWLTST
jgi:hypothetical protein